MLVLIWKKNKVSFAYVFLGSVLFQDEMNHSQGATGGSDVVINMDSLDKNRFQQQMQLIDQQVSEKGKCVKVLIEDACIT